MDSKKLSNSLLQSLLLFLKTYDKPTSKHTLLDSMPKNRQFDVPNMFEKYQDELMFVQIAKKAGIQSKLTKKSFNELSRLYCPAIIILNDDTSVILDDIDTKAKKAVLLYEDGIKEEIDFKKLAKMYNNHLFLLKKEYLNQRENPHLLDKNRSHWFWGTIFKNASLYKDIIIASVLINIFVLASPFFVMNVYDRVVPNFAVETLWALVIGICVIYLFDMATKFIRLYFIDMASKKIDIIISSKLFDKILNIKLENRPKSVGSFASNIKDFELIKNFFSSSTISVLVDIPFVFIFLIAIFYLSGAIVSVPIIFMFMILLYSLIIKKPLHGSIEAANQAVSFKNGILIESLNGLETIKSLGTSGHLRWKWEESTADISQKSIFTKILTASVTNVNAFFMQLNTVVVVIYGVYAIENRELTLGGLIAAVILSSRAIAPMAQFASLLSNYEQAKTSYKMLANIMSLPEERGSEQVAIQKEKIAGKIDFKNVGFYYDENKKVLDGVNFNVKKGEKVAIIGKIGSGKSTLFKILMKLYDAKEGEIMVDEIELKQIDPQDVRKNMAYVSQDSLLFNGTLRENILYKYPNANDEKLLHVTKIAQLLDFVNTHPQGFEMSVGERGDTLSGGQKKAISLARALIGDYSVLLLDEPTDSMDVSTEKRLIRDLKGQIQDKTVLVITHKNSMLELVDRIIVMDNGKVVLDGDKEYVLKALSGKANG